MKPGFQQWLKRLPAMLTAPPTEPAERAQRTVALQRNIILPARLVVIGVVFYKLYFQSPWLVTVITSYGVLLETIQTTLNIYAFLIVGATVLFSVVRRPPPGSVQWVVFSIGLADGVFLAALTILTRGFESPLYWVYPAVIVLNAISIPLATPQIVLNLVLTILYLIAGQIESNTNTSFERFLSGTSVQKSAKKSTKITAADLGDLPAVMAWLKQSPPPVAKVLWESMPLSTREKLSHPIVPGEEEALKADIADAWNGTILRGSQVYVVPTATTEPAETQADPYVLRVVVLLLLTFCCYGVQVLMAAQERAQEEQKEFYVRTGQLQMAGRLAAEFAHQIKNPLAIVNNVTYSMQKSLQAGKPEAAEKQIGIVQEEIAKADQIITQIMGYAQLSEGRVEKLEVIDEMEHALREVFPEGAMPQIKVHRDFADEFPPLLMQRRHFSESVINLLQNARDVVAGGGNIFVRARCLPNYSVEIVVRDDGPGIPPDKCERIFEAYYTTKERGTGLGLAIVKHNADLYGGIVNVESELGKGAKFTLVFPAKSLIQLG